MILAYFCTFSCWAILIRNWGYVNNIGKVLLTLIALASITFVRDAHKERQKARRSHYSDYIREDHCDSPNCYCAGPYELEGMDEWLVTARKRFPNTEAKDLIGFNFYSGEPKENSPYGQDADGCTDPKTSSRKQGSLTSEFYEWCEEMGYSQEERPLVFKEWLNDSE